MSSPWSSSGPLVRPVPGGPPRPFHLSVTGLTAQQADGRHVALYFGPVPDILQIRENGSWHGVPFQWISTPQHP
ncbi:hypothetical protein M2158_005177 [Streptomyces sp. SAI-144]|uniref:hypothetical protein n=1 Tax=Streptomyces sp. SAI-144 TaxID=2940544 RepID=UPI0024740E89|nr:hypothetical protein [Streptomyces sp. SAI-144]MDH6436636.1 hypothetical protein [Streptomyces sp. SAI-144]